MRDFSGRTSALLANYDQSLLVLVLSALAGGRVEPRRCTALPWRTVAVQDLPPPLRTYVAAGNLALIDAKLRDDVEDGGRWYAGLARLWLWRKTRKALRELARMDFSVSLVADLPARQSAVERDAASRLAVLAEPSAALLAEIFAHGGRLLAVATHTSNLARFGHAVARAIYGLDALEDHDEDRTKGRFNAVAACVAQQVGHVRAVESVRQFVEHAVIEAQQCATRLLPADRQHMVASILQQLAQRASAARDHLLGRPARAAMRPAEAGDCDGCCDGCSGCDSCDGDDQTCSCCSGGHCWHPGPKSQRDPEGDAEQTRVSGMPMRE